MKDEGFNRRKRRTLRGRKAAGAGTIQWKAMAVTGVYSVEPNVNLAQGGIESANGERSRSAIQELPLPKGEGGVRGKET